MEALGKQRIIYSIIIIVTIFTGLLVRIKSGWFPDVVNLYLGDILYASMMFYIVSFIVPHKKPVSRGLISLLICYCIELLQMYESPWADAVRATLPGRLILGSGFLRSDLAAYLIGTALALGVSKFAQIHPNTP